MRKTKLSDHPLLKFGHDIQLAGAIYSDPNDHCYLVMFPGEAVSHETGEPMLTEVEMTQDSWVELLRQTDLLETEILQKAADGKLVKAIIRKSTRQIEQGVSWAVYHRDNYRCRYCGKGEGTPLTVDHLVTWESGGPSTMENLVSACRKCNKTRGDLPYAEWLKHPHYVKVSQNLTNEQERQNVVLLGTLDKIPRRVHQRSR